MTQTPAGWYADPDPGASAGSLRYWDGAAWTEHVHAMPASTLQTEPTTPDGEPLASWWSRLGALLIDNVILGTVAGILALPGLIQAGEQFIDDVEPHFREFEREVEQNPEAVPDFQLVFDAYIGALQDHAMWIVLPSLILAVAYYAGFWRWKGATPGKLLLGLRVRMRDRAGRLPWGAIGARLLLPVLLPQVFNVLAFASGSFATVSLISSLATLIVLIDPLWAAWDDRRQALHDKLAGTNVVKTR